MGYSMEGKSKWGAKFKPWNIEGVDVAVRNAQGSSNSAIIATSNEVIRGMVLPFQLFSLTFNHVNYYVGMLAKMKNHEPHVNNHYDLKAFLAIQGINYEKICSCIHFLEAIVDFKSSWECFTSALLTKDLILKANTKFPSEPHILHASQGFPNSSAFF